MSDLKTCFVVDFFIHTGVDFASSVLRMILNGGPMGSFSSYSLECIVSVLIVGFLWGATNPLLRLGSRTNAKKKENVTSTSTWKQILSPLSDFATLFLNWRFSIPFAVNQSASVMFIYMVSIFPVSVVVPCVNALQFVFTAIVAHFIGERTLNCRRYVGIWSVLVGVLIMMLSDANETSSQ